MPPRISVQVSSPAAMSATPTGVASIDSYVRAYRSLKNMLYVASKIAPFIAEMASMAGATYCAYGTVRPSPNGIRPTRAPTPTPIESR